MSKSGLAWLFVIAASIGVLVLVFRTSTREEFIFWIVLSTLEAGFYLCIELARRVDTRSAENQTDNHSVDTRARGS